MLNKLILSIFIFSSLCATEYATTSNVVGASKDLACSKALDSARAKAVSQAGTFVISSYYEKISEKNEKVDTFSKRKISAISLGFVKNF